MGGSTLFIRIGGLPFKLTPEHPVLVISPSREIRNGVEKKRTLSNLKPAWKHAMELKVGDWLLVPRVSVESKKAENVVIRHEKYYCRRCGHAFIAQREDAKQHQCGKCKSKNVEFKGYREKVIDVNSKEFAWLLGLFIADGYVHKNGSIIISLNRERDKEIVERVKWVWSLVYKTPKVHTYGNAVRVVVNDKKLARWFAENCYRNGEKVIPGFVLYMDNDYIESFLEGMWAGDRKDFYAISSSSPIITYQLFLLINKLGRLPAIHISTPERVRVKNGKVIKEKTSYNIEFRKRKKYVNWLPLGDYYAVKIERIEVENYNGYVYNLETEDNTYAIPYIVHNSYDGEASTQMT